MKNLLYKEFRLARHPTMWIFPFLGAMLIIPSYVYYVAFIYTCLTVYFIFLMGRENKDILFTATLPVGRKEIVRARIVFITFIELFQVAAAVPFALLGGVINPSYQSNLAGIEANVAFFGLVLMMYAVFNMIFLPLYYKTAYKVGLPFALAGITMFLFIGVCEIAVHVPGNLAAWMDSTDPAMMVRQIPVLIAGVLLYAAAMILSCRLSIRSFEKADL